MVDNQCSSLAVSPCKMAIGMTVAGVGGYGLYCAVKRIQRCFKSKEQLLREDELELEPGAIFLNHGSFGTVPKCVSAFQRQLRAEMEQHPDRWFRRTTSRRFAEASAAVAAFVKAPKECVALVDNATTGVNAVLGSLRLSGDDEVLITDWTYQAVQNTTEYLCQRRNIKHVRLALDFPIASEDELVARFETVLDQYPNIRVCVLDHITSPSAVLIPVKRLTQLLHSRNVRVMVDGAHAPGQVKLDMVDLDADFYTGNLHKWCYAPRGCAFLYVRQRYLDEVMPCVISWLWKQPFQERFENLGTRDHTAMFCAAEALKFIDERLGGPQAVVQHNSDLAAAAADFLAMRWGTEKLAIPTGMEAPNLRLVRLPMEGLYSDANDIMMDIYDAFNVMTCTFPIKGVPYCRVSANVYNEMWEYERLAECVLQLRDRKLLEKGRQ